MYNLALNQTVPLHTSIAVTVCLQPWFEAQVLEKALAILRQSDLSHFFFHRHIACAVFENEYPLTIVFVRTTRISQGFTLKTQHCALCDPSGYKKRCEHIAALCLLSLNEKSDCSPLPMPLEFGKSKWAKLANFLYDWLKREQGQLERGSQDEKLFLKRIASEGDVQAQLLKSTVLAWQLFDKKPHSDIVSNLHKSAQQISLSDTEKQLIEAGSTSQALARDISLWNRLCTLFYCLSAEEFPHLSYDKNSGLFHLEYCNEETGNLLKINLPKKRTLEIINHLGIRKPGFSTLHPARQGCRVQMGKNGQIMVDPIIWLDDQQAVLLSEISDKKFGNCYLFIGEGFRPLRNCDPKAKIIRPLTKHAANPLFDYINQELAFEVADSELHDFLRENKISLSHSDNQVDEQIFNLQIKELPDTLIIHDFQEDQDWYYLSCDYGIGNSSISLDELIEIRGERDSLYSETTFLQLHDTPLSWFHDLALKRTWTDSEGRRGVRLLPGEFMSLISIIEDVENKLNDNSFQNRLETLLDSNSWSDPVKISYASPHLRDYQRNGLAWLHTLYELGFGGLLADDMGLGKTHQGLALLETISKRKKEQIMLVVCPASVLPHWRDKIDQFYPEINYSFYYGPNRDLHKAIQSGLILTTYGIVRSDQEQLAEISFEIILLDEIQNLKNRKTTIHKTVSSLQSRVKIGLSGTPIENSLIDLFSLFDICLPGIFGSINQFRQTFVKPITEKHDKKQKAQLSRLIDPFILRRSRSQVLTELPELIEDNRICELSEDQIGLYRQAVVDQENFLEELEAGDTQINYINVLTLITRLKQICNHPCLVGNDTDPNKYKSGKWDLFVEILNESLDNGLNVVVFSQYTGMLDIIEHYLEEAGIGFAGLRGNMSVAKREKMMGKFTRDKGCKVLCSSLLAGGTGIDLLAAQVVIHYDRWWNPAKEEQATARVHRMGQKDVVQLFRFITVGTLEEKIHNIISRKQELASSIINEDEGGIIKQLNHRQLVELFK